jgi:hypothetical protein
LFISKDYACYTAATPHKARAVIAFRDVLSIQKEATFGLIPNSVKITCWDERATKKQKEVGREIERRERGRERERGRGGRGRGRAENNNLFAVLYYIYFA